MKKSMFCLLSIILLNIPLQHQVLAADDTTKTTDIFTKAQIKKVQQIAKDYIDNNPDQVKKIQQVASDYIVKNPQVLVEAGKKLQELEEKARIEKIKTNISKYKNQIFDAKAPGRIILGNPQGKIIVAEFTQYQCSHCRLAVPVVANLLKNNPEVQLQVIYWPFLGNDSIYTAKALLAAKNQNKFEELEKVILAEQSPLTKDKTDSIIKSVKAIDSKKLFADIDSKEIENGLKANLDLAQKLELIGTPSFVFTNNDMTKISLIPGQTSHFEDDLAKSLRDVR